MPGIVGSLLNLRISFLSAFLVAIALPADADFVVKSRNNGAEISQVTENKVRCMTEVKLNRTNDRQEIILEAKLGKSKGLMRKDSNKLIASLTIGYKPSRFSDRIDIPSFPLVMLFFLVPLLFFYQQARIPKNNEKPLFNLDFQPFLNFCFRSVRSWFVIILLYTYSVSLVDMFKILLVNTEFLLSRIAWFKGVINYGAIMIGVITVLYSYYWFRRR